jgi:hypothetical protein
MGGGGSSLGGGGSSLGGGGSSLGGTALWSAPEMLEAWSGGKDAPHTPAGDCR